MFVELNTQLQEAKERLRQKRKYEEHLQRVTKFFQEEVEKKERLQLQLSKEKEDVAKLESFSLTNIFYTIIGRKLEKLDKEQQEVLAAKLKYQEALETIEDVRKEIEEYKDKLLNVRDAEQDYDWLMEEKERLIHDTDSLWSEELFKIAEKEADATSQLKEYQEAIRAGEEAKRALAKALQSLDSAKGWSTFDMLGGGMITTAIKHSRLDDARETIHQAQNSLRHFQEELLDIDNHFHSQLQFGGMLTFADYFFDGIVVDWIVHGKITDCYRQTTETKEAVIRVLRQLSEQSKALEGEIIVLQQQRMALLESAN